MTDSPLNYYKNGQWWPSDVVYEPIQSGLVGWWDADDASTITASGTAVSQWDNKGSTAVNLTQATGAAQPFTGTRTQNGRNVIEFDAAQWMEGGDNFDLLTADITLFIVAKQDTVANHVYVGKSRASATAGRWSLLRDSTTGAITDGGFISFTDSSTSARELSLRFRRIFSPGLQIRQNGVIPVNAVNINTNDTANYNTANIFGVGAYQNSSGNFNPPQSGLYLNGFIAEVCIWNRALQDFEMDQMHRYLKLKWGL
jgi:hypothetical protein